MGNYIKIDTSWTFSYQSVTTDCELQDPMLQKEWLFLSMVATLTLHVKFVELCETSFLSANLLPGEVWPLPAGFVLQTSKVGSFTRWKKSEFNALETMAANMNEHETFSGFISFEDINFSQSTAENNSANNLTFSEDEEEEANTYDLQGCIL